MCHIGKGECLDGVPRVMCHVERDAWGVSKLFVNNPELRVGYQTCVIQPVLTCKVHIHKLWDCALRWVGGPATGVEWGVCWVGWPL